MKTCQTEISWAGGAVVTGSCFNERWSLGLASWDVSNFLAGSNFTPESKVAVDITSCLGVLLKGNDVFRFMLYAV